MAIPTKADNRGVEWGEGRDLLKGPTRTTVTYIGPGGQMIERRATGWPTADEIMGRRPKGFDFVMLPFLNRWQVYDLRKVTTKTVRNKYGSNVSKEYILPEPLGVYAEREPAIALALLTYGS